MLPIQIRKMKMKSFSLFQKVVELKKLRISDFSKNLKAMNFPVSSTSKLLTRSAAEMIPDANASSI